MRTCPACRRPFAARTRNVCCSVDCAKQHSIATRRNTDKSRVLDLIRDYRGLPLSAWDVSDELGRLTKARVRELLEELTQEGEVAMSRGEFGERLYRDARRDEAAA